MTLNSQEFIDMMADFERLYSKELPRIARENKIFWIRGQYYQNGDTNAAFRWFQRGYAHGRAVYLNQ